MQRLQAAFRCDIVLPVTAPAAFVSHSLPKLFGLRTPG